MADNMTKDGIALIRPMVWTGVMGGHFVEYFGYRNTDQTPSIEPWAHLRGLAPPANTYLNKLTRRDYVRLFSERFDILEERESEPGLGQHLLTEEIIHETGLDDYELLSNNVRFALRPKKSP